MEGAQALLPRAKAISESVMFARFKTEKQELYQAFQASFAYLQSGQEEGYDQSVFWDTIPHSRLGYFVWDKSLLTTKQAKTTYQEPGYYEEKWNVHNLLESIHKLDCTLSEVTDINGGLAELRVKDAGPAYEGLDPLLGLLEAFGLELVGYEDDGDYLEVSFG